MPNLQTIVSDADERRRSLHRMCGAQYARVEPRFNHGIRTPQELEALVCQPPYDGHDDEDLKAAAEEIKSENKSDDA